MSECKHEFVTIPLIVERVQTGEITICKNCLFTDHEISKDKTIDDILAKLSEAEGKLEAAEQNLYEEREEHAKLQARCYEGFPTISDGIFSDRDDLRRQNNALANMVESYSKKLCKERKDVGVHMRACDNLQAQVAQMRGALDKVMVGFCEHFHDRKNHSTICDPPWDNSCAMYDLCIGIEKVLSATPSEAAERYEHIEQAAKEVINRCGLLEDDYESTCHYCDLQRRTAKECKHDCPVSKLHNALGGDK